MEERKKDSGARKLLNLLLNSDEKTETSAHQEASKLPTMDERVDMFLRGVHGEREFTAEERAAAKERLLESMAQQTAEEIQRTRGSQ